MKPNQKNLFETRLDSAKEGSGSWFDEELLSNKGPVTCLGQTFANDEQRRKHFNEELRKKLQDPEFRNIEGFPLAADEDILALSDPPYYTACPNPWSADFVQHYGKPYDPDIPYSREPFAADVSEGKNDPVYNAHSYHTKVPHKAIMRYILHYTEPGDLVFDGFCGTGMTGVAAQACGDKAAVESLGYKVDSEGNVFEQEFDAGGKETLRPFSRLGARRAILSDLSPAASFIAYNYNNPVDVQAFEREARRILKKVEDECGWMYETLHTDGKTKGKINYTVWSDVFICPDCSKEVVFWEAAVDKAGGKVLDEFPCPHCQGMLSKKRMERAWSTKFDQISEQNINQAKQVPVLINYSFQGKRAEKKPDEFDLELIEKIENSQIPYWYPNMRLMEGEETRRNDPIGITHVHHFYTKRNLWVLAALLAKSHSFILKLIITGIIQISSKQSSFRYDSRNPKNTAGGILKGTLYIPSISREGSIFENYQRRLSSLISGFKVLSLFTNPQSIGTSSLETTFLCANSLDYIFIDPPFGSNLNYSELNFLWESWLKVWTNNQPEAIENKVQNKGPNEYRELMAACFKEAYRVLKPGHWMTVEFSNTRAAVWNSIQSALTQAGFIVANVAALDKQQGSFKAVTTPTAVKQDLVISAYKPNGGFEGRFEQKAETEEGAWDFVRSHLKYLPVIKHGADGASLQVVREREPRRLYDQMLAYYVRRGFHVPLNSTEFQEGLEQFFPKRDGMCFLPEQLLEYDRKKLSAAVVEQPSLFINDEASAIDWLRQQLQEKPQLFQDINPLFMRELSAWEKHEKSLELSELLEQNFLRYEGKGQIPAQLVSWMRRSAELRPLIEDELHNQGIELTENLPLSSSSSLLLERCKDRWYVPNPNQAGDLEKLREKTLLKQFEQYVQRKSKFKRSETFRLEAVRAGFKKAWQERDYTVIITVAEKIPESILQEDPKLLMWYDQAVTRFTAQQNKSRINPA